MSPIGRRVFLKYGGACIASPLLGACSGGDVSVSRASQFQLAVQQTITQYGIPGVVASVRMPGQPEWKQAFGYADVAGQVPFNPDSFFPIRSVTKSFTATLVLELVRNGLVTLDSVLETFVPGIPNGQSITLADLAGMQTGIADYSATPAFRQAFISDVTQAFTETQLVDFAIPASPVFAPGAEYQYCNTNTVLLGRVVETVTGQSFSTVLQSGILGPLNLTHTAYPMAVALPDPHPTPYDLNVDDHSLTPLPLINPTALAASGAMTSTVDDLQIWALALGQGRLIGTELRDEQIARSRTVTNGPTYDRYGLGIGILDSWWGHTGSGLGFQIATFYDPASTTTIVVAVNASVSGGARNLNLAEEIFKQLAASVSH
ncbi:serine hydrolase [Paraburkholderia fungorum]|uniref:serine hydrolase domain-containing protein n=1 Tax=Paraburkholderia fungorum TaxID=134537 RepID=UPI0038BBAC26